MNASDIIHLRLQNQYLIGEKFTKGSEVVNYFGAVQAQDFAAAKWSLGRRVENATDEIIEKEYNDGNIIRTHVMRPTWHFIAPENLSWMQELTAYRVKQLMKTYNKKLELTDDVFKKTNKVITDALVGNTYLNRQEIKKLLEKIHIQTDVQRLAHIVMWAELDGLICSGPRKGKQFTYALVEERIPKRKKLSHDEALSSLASMYFSSHGPAQLKDFSWWSGLPVKEAESGIDMISSNLEKVDINGKIYWFDKPKKIKSTIPNAALLISIFDEYTIAYKDRSALAPERYLEKLITMGNVLTAVFIIDGVVAGTWKRTIKKDLAQIFVSPMRKLTKNDMILLEKEVQEYGRFLSKRVEIVFK